MTGLFLLAIVGLWVWLVFRFSRWIGFRRETVWGRFVAPVVVFATLVPLPVADEIVGGFQLGALCTANATDFRIGSTNPEGRTVRVTIDPSNQRLAGKAIPIRHSRVTYRDAASGEQLVAFDQYVASGGVFIRALGISESNSPITIGTPACSPEQTLGESARLTFKLNIIK